MYRNIIKPIFDRTAACILLGALTPFIALISVILLLIQRDVFFFQLRPGKNAKVFKLIKFKTLKSEAGTQEIPINSFANFLRKSSLDELPQLVNILKGEMSFIGPRPLLEEYLPLYSRMHQTRHAVLPGLSGLAQINGRNLTTWSERLDLDVKYVENISLYLDLKITLITIQQLFWKPNGGSSVTMARFEGYQ